MRTCRALVPLVLIAAASILSVAWLVNPTPPATADEGPGSARQHELAIADFMGKLYAFGQENRRLNVAPQHGRYLRLMVEASDAQRALEIGTSNGYSSIWIALGLEQTGGHLTTIEILPERVVEAKKNLADAGLSEYVTCLEGDAFKVIPTLEGKTYDFLFIDALKPDYIKFLTMLLPQLDEGAIVMGHNAVSQADNMRDYLNLIQSDPRFTTTIVQIEPGDGFAVSYYHGGA